MTRERDTFDMFQQQQHHDRGRFGDNERRPDNTVRAPRVTGASDLIDIEMVHHLDRSTAKAVFVSSFGDRKQGSFLPKSQIEIEPTGQKERRWVGAYDQRVCVTLPEWLAREKGLI